MSSEFLILAVNPGSTSTKMALFKREEKVFEETLRHDRDELKNFKGIWDQFDFRKKVIVDYLKSHPLGITKLSAVVGRGGIFKPIVSGTYNVNEEMLDDARTNRYGEHASNLGCALANEISKEFGNCPSYIVDPTTTCEYQRLSFYSGHPEIPRKSIAHVLNVHATARKAAKDLNIPYEKSRLIVVHMGGGITVSAVVGGKMIDNNNATCEGPFTPERTGSLPPIQLAELCFSGKYTLPQIKKMIMGKGGFVAYLGTNSAQKVEQMAIAGDKRAREHYEALIYQVAKEIGAYSTVLFGKLDAIVLTGGLAYSDFLMKLMQERIDFLGKVVRYPGEDELEALSAGAFRVLKGIEDALVYPTYGEKAPEWNTQG
ncbi:MAG: butyrate kinase [Caldisericia bacterium]|nr:butyrate kinase [Caldisericia bacterium]